MNRKPKVGNQSKSGQWWLTTVYTCVQLCQWWLTTVYTCVQLCQWWLTTVYTCVQLTRGQLQICCASDGQWIESRNNGASRNELDSWFLRGLRLQLLSWEGLARPEQCGKSNAYWITLYDCQNAQFCEGQWATCLSASQLFFSPHMNIVSKLQKLRQKVFHAIEKAKPRKLIEAMLKLRDIGHGQAARHSLTNTSLPN